VAVRDAVTGTLRREETMREEQEDAMDARTGQAAGERGFALILAILALMLLTMLGLALATTTSTELQIATNYRWSQQALYNAEAGVEAGKSILRTINWQAVLPAARLTTAGAPWDGKTSTGTPGGGATAPFSRNDAWGNPTRNYENSSCDQRGFGMGYGVILDDGTASAPYQYVTTAVGQNLNGAFTLWIRRPLNYRADTQLEDYSADNDNMVLVSEGVAPYTGGNIASAFGAANRAVQVIEVSLGRVIQTQAGLGCGGRSGQVGGGPLGAGFGGCEGIVGGAGVTGALAGAPTGTGAELNPNQ
jgi:Tfp pilus assembly protein PilX